MKFAPNLVSIVMPMFNAELTIARAITSVLEQTYAEIELILIDDCSKDRTLLIVKNFQDRRIKLLINDQNSGVAFTRNRGIFAARGRYVAFCDSDDFWYEDKLSQQLGLMKKSSAAVSHGSCRVVDLKGKYIRTKKYPEIVTSKMMLTRNYICNSSAIFDRRSIELVAQNDIYHEDYDMWITILNEAGFSVGLPRPILDYTSNPEGLSSNKIKSFIGSLRIQKKHGVKGFRFFICLFGNIMSRIWCGFK